MKIWIDDRVEKTGIYKLDDLYFIMRGDREQQEPIVVKEDMFSAISQEMKVVEGSYKFKDSLAAIPDGDLSWKGIGSIKYIGKDLLGKSIHVGRTRLTGDYAVVSISDGNNFSSAYFGGERPDLESLIRVITKKNICYSIAQEKDCRYVLNCNYMKYIYPNGNFVEYRYNKGLKIVEEHIRHSDRKVDEYNPLTFPIWEELIKKYFPMSDVVMQMLSIELGALFPENEMKRSLVLHGQKYPSLKELDVYNERGELHSKWEVHVYNDYDLFVAESETSRIVYQLSSQKPAEFSKLFESYKNNFFCYNNQLRFESNIDWEDLLYKIKIRTGGFVQVFAMTGELVDELEIVSPSVHFNYLFFSKNKPGHILTL